MQLYTKMNSKWGPLSVFWKIKQRINPSFITWKVHPSDKKRKFSYKKMSAIHC